MNMILYVQIACHIQIEEAQTEPKKEVKKSGEKKDEQIL